MERIEIAKKKVEFEKGKPMAYRVNKLSFEGKHGKPFSFETFELYEPIQYVLKKDRGTKKAGEKDVFRNTEFNLNRMKDVLKVLYEIDMKYNDGKGFHTVRIEIEDDVKEKLTRKAMQPNFAEDDIPF